MHRPSGSRPFGHVLGSPAWLQWGLQCVQAHADRCFSSGLFFSKTSACISNVRRDFLWGSFAEVVSQPSPWSISVSDVHIIVYGNILPESCITEALTGCVVGLAKNLPGHSVLRDIVGIGIVRAVHAVSKRIFVLSQLSSTRLADVCCILVFDSNFSAHLRSVGAPVSKMPYLCSSGLPADGTGAGVFRSRNNLLRRWWYGRRSVDDLHTKDSIFVSFRSRNNYREDDDMVEDLLTKDSIFVSNFFNMYKWVKMLRDVSVKTTLFETIAFHSPSSSIRSNSERAPHCKYMVSLIRIIIAQGERIPKTSTKQLFFSFCLENICH